MYTERKMQKQNISVHTIHITLRLKHKVHSLTTGAVKMKRKNMTEKKKENKKNAETKYYREFKKIEKRRGGEI